MARARGRAAKRLSREAVLIELNPCYAHMARERIVRPLPLLASLVTLEIAVAGAAQFGTERTNGL